MGVGEVIGGLLVDIVRGAAKAIKAGARKALPSTRKSAEGTKADGAKAYEDLKRLAEERKGGKL